MQRGRGFTLVELIGIIAIAGILLAVAAPRFFNANTFAARGYADAASGFLRYVQKLAVARHSTLYVHVASSGLTLCATAPAPCAGAGLLPGQDGQTPFQVQVPSGVTQSGSATHISFDAQGRPSGGLTLSITSDSTRTLSVEAETGYVH
jgi:MSHA pilin protein MshC